MDKRTLRYAVAGTAAVSTALIIAACGGSSSYGVGWPYLITVPGVDSTGTYSFDLGTVDTATGRYYVTDRTTKSVDVVDIASKVVIAQFNAGSFFGCAAYDGTTAVPLTKLTLCNAQAIPSTATSTTGANNDTSGPDGLDVVGNNLFVGDVGKLWILNKTTGAVVATIAIPSAAPFTTGVTTTVRADEGCYDSVNNIYAISTPGDAAPFMTFIDVANNKVIYKLVMNDTGGPSAGLEACTYDPKTNMIFVNNDGSTANANGEMDGIPMAGIVALKAGEVASSATLGAYPTNGAGAWNAVAGLTTGKTWALPALCDPTGLALGKPTASGSEIGFMCRPGTPGTVMLFGVLDSATASLTTNAPIYTVNAGGGDQITYSATTDKWYLADSRWTPSGKSCGSGSATCNLTPNLIEVGGTSHAIVAMIPTGNNAHSVAAGSGYVFSPYNKFTSVNTGGSLVGNTTGGGGGIEMNPM